MDIDTKSSISNKLNFIYIEIPKFKKKREELSKHLEYWLYFFRELNRLREIPEEFKGDILEDAFKRAEFLKLSSQEQHNYHINLKHYRDLVNSLDTALERGFEKGVEKGIEKGIKEGKKVEKIEIAKKLLSAKIDIDTIILSTSLSKEEIENLSNF
jgi:predicted transposase/invertase (TIGR01784 family)